MKKNVTILLFLAMSSSLFGQHKSNIKFGVHAGANVSHLLFGRLDTKLQKFGVQMGISANFLTADVYWLSAGLNYAQLGSLEKFADNTLAIAFLVPTSKTLQFNYVQMPLLLSMREKGWRFDAGLYGGYLLSAYQKMNFSNPSFDTKMDYFQNDNEEMRRFDGGVQFGVGYIHDWGIDVMLGAQVGLIASQPMMMGSPLTNPVRPSIPTNEVTTHKGTNINLSLTVGYRF